MAALRLLTINTGKCDGPYGARIAWLAAELRALAPDVLALQEAFVAADGTSDTAATLADALGLHAVVAPARRKRRLCEGRLVDGWSCPALLARWPWAAHTRIALPADPRDGERVAILGRLALPGAALVVASLHLSHLPDAAALRAAQLRATLEHSWFADGSAIRLVLGDLNTAHGRALEALLAAALAEQPLVAHDLYTLGGGAARRGTLPPRRPGDERPAIDYVLAVAGEAAPPPAATAARIVLDRAHPTTAVLPSDHYGVAVTLRIPSSGACRGERTFQ